MDRQNQSVPGTMPLSFPQAVALCLLFYGLEFFLPPDDCFLSPCFPVFRSSNS